MKKTGLIAVICASLFILVNASVWEGAAAVASGAELPESGLYMATNSFPANTIVDVTNLENGKTTRVIASSALEAPGLLALLSRDAASAIGLQGRSLGRIRMSQPADPVAFSRFTEGLITSGDPDYDPAAFVALNGIPPEEPAAEAGNGRIENGELIVDLDPAEDPAAEGKGEELTPYLPLAVTDDAIVPEKGPVAAGPKEAEPDYDLSLKPADTRPPIEGPGPEISRIIPAIPESSSGSEIYPIIPSIPEVFYSPEPEYLSDYIDPSMIIDPIGEAPVLVETVPSRNFPAAPVIEPEIAAPPQVFSAPLISSLEKGKYYLQIAAYSKEETVQSEISRIGGSYPVAIMNAGSLEKPVYRVLIGPVNLGESGALLQRFKVSHKGAFIRLGT